MYSIKAVSQATGLSVGTLRAWERRYGVVVPGRDDMGRRAYGPQEVLHLRRLREATERGHPIGRLAHLDARALDTLLDESAAAPDQAESAAANAFRARILDAARRFRATECEQVLTLAIAMLPPARLIDDVLGPLLQEVGERWHGGEFSIAQERMVSTAVRRHVGLMVEAYDRAARRRPIVFATLPGERHELGLLMSALICGSHGFKVHYLGPDLPAEEIARYARSIDAAVVALSIVLLDGLERRAGEIGTLAEGLPAGTLVWLGGSGTQALERETLPARCAVISGQRELEQRLELLAS
jgi:methanogenic corrinoid protein MtbC1